MTTPPHLLASGITKRYPGVLALDGATLEIRTGEVRGVVGENGAGKSTLMQILAGATSVDEGRIELNGTAVQLDSPGRARSLGIHIVYQELSLVRTLTVAENVFANRQPVGAFGLIRPREMVRRTQDLIEAYGFANANIRPHALVGEHSIGQQQLVEILKAIAEKPQILILDEPTSSLGRHDVDHLFEAIRRLKESGVTVIYISHQLAEVFQIADTITVMKDGATVATAPASTVDEEWLISRMVGREITDLFRVAERSARSDRVVLSVRGLSSHEYFRAVNLDVNAGEVLGVAGLVGSGRTELARAIAGLVPAQGEVAVMGTPVRLGDPMASARAGISYVTEDRRVDGLFLELPIWENTAAQGLTLRQPYGMFRPGSLRAEARRAIEAFRIATPSETQRVGLLSGGNQQKVLLAGRLLEQPKVLLLDEPTRGVDVGAKEEIYALMRQRAAEGMGLMMVSSDLIEIMGMSDRIAVLREGRLVGTLDRESATEEGIMQLATGVMQGRSAA